MSQIKDKVALVTGSSRGIGREIALELARRGAKVVINCKEGEREALQVASEVEAQGSRSLVAFADVASLSDVKKMFAQIEEKLGAVAILVNNAGITRDKSFLKMSPENWKDVLDVNLNGAFYCAHLAVPGMVQAGYGRIVNISSVIGQTGGFGQANYAASKAGLLGLTKTLALELAKHGVTANAVCPGFIDTEILSAIPPEVTARIKEKIPSRRLGLPGEIAKLVGFLVEDGAYITGAAMNINGGYYTG